MIVPQIVSYPIIFSNINFSSKFKYIFAYLQKRRPLASALHGLQALFLELVRARAGLAIPQA
jgi:hypothetical protein